MTGRADVALVAEPETARDAGQRTVTFDDGLYGFPECRDFTLAQTSRKGLYWLQSTDHEALCLLLADPFVFFRGYTVDLPAVDVKQLDAADVADVAILVTVILPAQPGLAGSANLQSPLAINVRTRRARQVILKDKAWGVREPIDLQRPA